MSYNIDHIECLKIEAWMRPADVIRLRDTLDFPEDNFLEDLEEVEQYPDRVPLTKLNWRGEGSGNSYYNVFLKEVAPCIQGEVEAIVVWEGGDAISGLRIKDGVPEEMGVEHRLVPAPPRPSV